MRSPLRINNNEIFAELCESKGTVLYLKKHYFTFTLIQLSGISFVHEIIFSVDTSEGSKDYRNCIPEFLKIYFYIHKTEQS